LIEREGMKRAIQVAAKADVVVAVIDAFAVYSRDSANNDNETADHDNEYTPNADAIIQNLLDEVMLQNATLQPENVLLVRNKSDLRKNSQQHQHENNAAQPSSRLVSDERSFDISCQTQDGIDKFLDALTRKVVARVGSSGTDGGDNDDSGENEGVSSSSSSSLITRARHRQHVQAAVEALDRFVSLSVHGSMTVDLAAEELRLAASELGRITGAVDVEDILDKLFADFCIGK
jgi:tRNA modification GTPase